MNKYSKNKQNDMKNLFKKLLNFNSKPIDIQKKELPDFEFAEWLNMNYIRLNKVWVHKYADQRNKINWKTTEELYEFWLNIGNSR